MDELGRLAPAEMLHATKHDIIVILEDVRSMQNVGAIFRSCDAFAVQELYLCGYTPCPPHRDIHKTALGATETVKWQHFADVTQAIAAAKEQGYSIAAIEQAHQSENLANAFEAKGKTAIILGNEVTGVSDTAIGLAERIIEIPQWGSKHSLNVSVTAGIVLWEYVRQLEAPAPSK